MCFVQCKTDGRGKSVEKEYIHDQAQTRDQISKWEFSFPATVSMVKSNRPSHKFAHPCNMHISGLCVLTVLSNLPDTSSELYQPPHHVEDTRHEKLVAVFAASEGIFP